ncbi:phosphoribosylglycinamide formyltransferase-1 [Filomicrobium insigne]|uniref:Phosphoribosylglycinamide formyltransferase n=1 Tax=Filomicrobium insigne TaxID=418854 RepID=A0A1H0MQI1_9HYPH|nr:phosphoribosylglycinamide formyltransferase [Filomicrobium insigne]SDO82698.1 phosphoribosylglycinamide formyltransferase-1 [Filomicrobium insigne]
MSSTEAGSKPVKKRVGVLISGRGSNMMSLVEAAKAPDYPAEIVVVVSNRPEAPGLAWAKDRGIPTIALDHRTFRSREEFDDQLHRLLLAARVEIVACAGFMRLMTPELVANWHNRMINIHPSLLPCFKGLHTHERALAAGVRISGCTVHAVRHEMDTGPILGQAAVCVAANDTAESLAARVLAAEHKLYPQILRLFASDQILLDENAVITKHSFPESPAIFSPNI